MPSLAPEPAATIEVAGRVDTHSGTYTPAVADLVENRIGTPKHAGTADAGKKNTGRERHITAIHAPDQSTRPHRRPSNPSSRMRSQRVRVSRSVRIWANFAGSFSSPPSASTAVPNSSSAVSVSSGTLPASASCFRLS